MQKRLFWILLAFASAVGLFLAWVDSQPTWDDSAILATLAFGISLLLSALMPARAWLWALAVGGWIPLVGILAHHNGASIAALIIAAIGAAIGAVGRRVLTTLDGMQGR